MYVALCLRMYIRSSSTLCQPVLIACVYVPMCVCIFDKKYRFGVHLGEHTKQVVLHSVPSPPSVQSLFLHVVFPSQKLDAKRLIVQRLLLLMTQGVT